MPADIERLQAALAGRYTIEAQVGAGGMATVYSAFDHRHERRVAVKVLRPEIALAAGSERFIREIRIAAGLTHPHIVPLFDSGTAAGVSYYVMPLVVGETLSAIIKREKQLDVEESLAFLRQIGQAISHAHRQGVVHRDLKPANVIVQDGDAMVTDFGVALALHGNDGDRLTDTGLAVGTPEYMSPEQASGARDVDLRSDIYSLACIGYELLTGEPPYVGANPQAVIAKHIVDPVPSARRLRSTVPAAVDFALEKALAKTPADRFGSVDEFIAGLFAADRDTPAVGGKSVAVLPFKDMGGRDGEYEYLGEGLAEDIIGQLAKLPDLKVISRASVMRFYDRNATIREIGRQLGVKSVLDGSVRRAGSRVRIATQLIDATTDETLWADRFDREITDVFALQAEVAERIATALEAELSPETRIRIDASESRDPEAYQLVLLGRFHANKWSHEGWQRGMRYLDQAIERDPSYAVPHATLALHNVIRAYVGALSPKDAYAKAEGEAQIALALDSNEADAHLAQALVSYFYHWNWNEAARSFERAIELSPGHSTAHTFYGSLLDTMCRPDEALRERRRGYELAPLDPTAAFNLGYGYLCGRRYMEAAAQFERALELDRTSLAAIYGLGITQVESGQPETACRTFENGSTIDRSSTMLGFLGWAYARAGRVEEARRVLMGLIESNEYVSSIHVALVHLGLELYDEFFEWLDRAISERSTWLVWIHVTPSFDPVMDHPKFRAALQRLGVDRFVTERATG